MKDGGEHMYDVYGVGRSS